MELALGGYRSLRFFPDTLMSQSGIRQIRSRPSSMPILVATISARAPLCYEHFPSAVCFGDVQQFSFHDWQ